MKRDRCYLIPGPHGVPIRIRALRKPEKDVTEDENASIVVVVEVERKGYLAKPEYLDQIVDLERTHLLRVVGSLLHKKFGSPGSVHYDYERALRDVSTLDLKAYIARRTVQALKGEVVEKVI